jgi:protein tyrosine/serine phosphatase
VGTPSSSPGSPWIDLDGADNLRDLGGLPTRDGGRIRRRTLLRSGTLQDVDAVGVKALVEEIGIRTVIDLRLENEVRREGSALLGVAGVDYLELPIWYDPQARMGDEKREREADVIEGGRRADMVAHYVGYLNASADAVGRAALVMADPARTPLVFNCAAGKDRTGVLAAIVLDAVEVERDAIVADYALSAERRDRIREHLLQLDTYREMRFVREDSGRAMPAEPESMRRLLDEMDERWGGGAGYLRGQCGLASGDIARLREALVEH